MLELRTVILTFSIRQSHQTLRAFAAAMRFFIGISRTGDCGVG
jgi:hypothetical protein